VGDELTCVRDARRQQDHAAQSSARGIAGTWSVVKDLGALGISASTGAKERALIGASILIADRTARFADDKCTRASYIVETQTVEDRKTSY
jgi:hypothetical protein